MSTFTVGAYPCTAITGLSATSSGLTVQFAWDQQLPTEKVQIYKGTTTTQGSATFLAATYDHNFQDALNSSSGTVYYWLRKINDADGVGSYSSMITATVTAASGGSVTISDGSITPAKLSSGFAIDPATGNLKASTVGISQLATTSVSGISPSASTGNSVGSVTSYGTWQSFATCQFTAAAHASYMLYMYLVVTYGTMTTTAFGDTMYVYARFRLRDNTTGTDVPGVTQQKLLFYAFDNAVPNGGAYVTYVSNPLAEINMAVSEGFRSQLINGHSYTLYGEVQKVQASGTPTMTVSVSAASSTASGASYA